MTTLTFKIVSIIIVAMALAQLPAPISHPAHAQGVADSAARNELLQPLPAELVGERAAELMVRLRTLMTVAEHHVATLANASKEDSLVLRMQVTRYKIEIFEDIHELTDILIAAEQDSSRPELRTEILAAYDYVTVRIWGDLERRRDEIDQTRAERVGAAAENRGAIEDRVSLLTERLDESYAVAMAHVEYMAALGIDTTAAYDALAEALRWRAEELSGRIDLSLARTDEMASRLAETPGDANVQTLLIAAQKSLVTNTTSMENTLDLMDKLKMQTGEYRTQLITTTRDFGTSIFDRQVAQTLFSRAVKNIKTWFEENGPNLLFKFLIFAVIMFFFRFLSRLARHAVERSLNSSKLDLSVLLKRMIVNTTGNLVMVLGLLIGLAQLGITLGPLLAGFGVVGFILGFALQDSLSNFAAGMMILMYRPYDVGDMVDIGGVFGVVDKMSLVSTSVLTVDNQRFVIPNNKIWGDVIKNVTAQDQRRVDMVFGISYTDDIPKAETVLMGILKQHEKVLDDPEPNVKLHTLNESSVDFVVRPWVAVGDYWDVYWDVTRAVKMRFDEEGISIPFPQRDVHLYQEKVVEARNSMTQDDPSLPRGGKDEPVPPDDDGDGGSRAG